MRCRFAPAAALALLAACATAVPRQPPDPFMEAEEVASATVADVEVVARAGAWRGWPRDLPRFVTPIHVSLVNRGAGPVRVGLDSFALVSSSGPRRDPIAPEEVRGVVFEPPPAALPSAGFSLGPMGRPWEPDWVLGGPMIGAWADPVARTGEQFSLPTPDVRNLALREGVLEPGRAASGFVYFERVPGWATPVNVAAQLIDAASGEPLDRVDIPLVLRSVK
jgi:hypothetical protein